MGSQSEWLKPALQSYWSKAASIFGAIDLTELVIREDFWGRYFCSASPLIPNAQEAQF